MRENTGKVVLVGAGPGDTGPVSYYTSPSPRD